MRQPFSLLCALAFFALNTFGSQAWAASVTDAAIQKLISERVASGQNSGIAAAVVDAAGVRYFFAGASGNAAAKELRKDTLFEIGSVTKVFTGLLLAEAVRREEVRLEDKIRSYLPQQLVLRHPDVANITLLDLATHMSGLPRMPLNWQAADPADPYAHYDADLLLEALTATDPGLKKSGTYLYSNFGAGLLGYLLSNAAHSDYAALVSARIAEPLGLADTTVALSPDQTQRLAQGYASAGKDNKIAPAWNFDALAGAGALKSTPQDLASFLQACMEMRKTSLDQALQLSLKTYRKTPEGFEMGLGWHCIITPERTFYYHDGGTGGFRSFVGFVKDMDHNSTGYLLLSNTAADVSDLGMHFLDTRFGLRTPRKAVSLPDAVLKAYAGTYHYRPGNPLLPEGLVATLSRTGNGLEYVCEAMSEQDKLLPFDKDQFFFESSKDVLLTFQRDSQGKVTGFVISAAGQELGADKIE